MKANDDAATTDGPGRTSTGAARNSSGRRPTPGDGDDAVAARSGDRVARFIDDRPGS